MFMQVGSGVTLVIFWLSANQNVLECYELQNILQLVLTLIVLIRIRPNHEKFT